MLRLLLRIRALTVELVSHVQIQLRDDVDLDKTITFQQLTRLLVENELIGALGYNPHVRYKSSKIRVSR